MTLLFSFPEFESISHEIKGDFKRGQFSLQRFSSGELHLTLQQSVLHEICFLLGSIAPPDSNLLSYLMLSHTLKKEGAGKCIAFLPYLAYSREEHPKEGKSQATALMGALLASSGIDKIVTIDLHSKMAEALFPIPLVSLSLSSIFSEQLKKIDFIPDVFVSPDEGGIERCQDVAAASGGAIPVAYMKKKRDSSGVIHLDLVGPIGKKVVIIDDILDTGKTLISCVKKLQWQGMERCIIMVSHGLFTKGTWEELLALGVESLYCSDSIPLKHRHKAIKVLSLAPLLEKSLCAIDLSNSLF